MGTKYSIRTSNPDTLPEIRQEIHDKAKRGDLDGLKALEAKGYNVHQGEKTLITALNHGHLEVVEWLYKKHPVFSMAVMFDMKGRGLQTLMKFQERLDFQNNISTQETFVGGILKQAAVKDPQGYEEICQSHGHMIKPEDKTEAELFRLVMDSTRK